MRGGPAPQKKKREELESHPRGPKGQNLKKGVVNRIKSLKDVCSSEHLVSLGSLVLAKVE